MLLSEWVYFLTSIKDLRLLQGLGRIVWARAPDCSSLQFFLLSSACNETHHYSCTFTRLWGTQNSICSVSSPWCGWEKALWAEQGNKCTLWKEGSRRAGAAREEQEQCVGLAVLNSPPVDTGLHDTEGENQFKCLRLIKFSLAASQKPESTRVAGLEDRERWRKGKGKFLWKGSSSWEYPGYWSVPIDFYFSLFLLIPVKSWRTQEILGWV